MIPEESVAYALAAWNRFDETISDGLLRAVSGAFVLVAAADGELSRTEAERFFEVLQSESEVFSAIDFRQLRKTFGDLADAMFADPEDGKRLALECVARVKGVPAHAELVKSAAQIAAAADGRLEKVEESAMQEIRRALGQQRG
ncbi:MAG TPA: TerB family tellurite resistance protein [Polyangiales bacterium]|nr:TerB family tellurite resistance protein [Polyangiales bacterium]